MARTLHRIITVAGFVPDADFADDPVASPSWDPIVLPPYTRKLSVWAVTLDGVDPDTNKVARGTTTLDLSLIYGDGVSFTEATPFGGVLPGRRTVNEDLPPNAELWVRCSALNTVDLAVTHIAIFYEKLVG